MQAAVVKLFAFSDFLDFKCYDSIQRNSSVESAFESVCMFCYFLQPKFAASLQILKVEIGGDSQSSGW